MAKKKYDYCGESYEDEYEGCLDNCNPDCPDCVAKEQEKEDMEQ